jgi:hypothetical protein
LITRSALFFPQVIAPLLYTVPFSIAFFVAPAMTPGVDPNLLSLALICVLVLFVGASTVHNLARVVTASDELMDFSRTASTTFGFQWIVRAIVLVLPIFLVVVVVTLATVSRDPRIAGLPLAFLLSALLGVAYCAREVRPYRRHDLARLSQTVQPKLGLSLALLNIGCFFFVAHPSQGLVLGTLFVLASVLVIFSSRPERAAL